MRNEPGCPVAKGRNATLHRPYGPSSARRDDGRAASPRTLARKYVKPRPDPKELCFATDDDEPLSPMKRTRLSF